MEPNIQPPLVAKQKRIYRGDNIPRKDLRLPLAPPWRRFDKGATRIQERGVKHQASEDEITMVNAALFLRRPLLVTGRPGTGKSSLAYAVAHELGLGPVLVWPITSRSTLHHGLYHYDAVGRLQEASLVRSRAQLEAIGEPPAIGPFIRLGPIGTAFATSTVHCPRVLLIDEVDKSDIDLPNDLLHIFEEGEFEIPELARLPAGENYDTVEVALHKNEGSKRITRGRVHCDAFPLVILTSNGEREFPSAFLRRCLRLDIPVPSPERLAEIVRQRLELDDNGETSKQLKELVAAFVQSRDKELKELAADQLLNAMYLITNGLVKPDISVLERNILRPLSDLAT